MRSLRLIAAFAALAAIAVPAWAGLQVCNKGKIAAKVALGRFDGKAWISQGWWLIAPGSCETILAGPLDGRYYYLYGTDGGSGTWSGDTDFCTKDGTAFSIARSESCAVKGYDRKGFFEIDTKDKTDVTQSLSD
jgi:uncharacterized membrane protein